MKLSKRKWKTNSKPINNPLLKEQPSQKAIDWAENTWFKSDPEMTDYAQRIHRGLVAEGFDTESITIKWFTQRVKLKFPSLLMTRSDN